MNQGVHTVDLLVATMGRPVEVFAYTGTLAHERIEVEDVAVGVVRFENGALGVLHATTAAYPGLSARLQVHGDRGSVVIDNDKLTFIHRTPRESSAEERAYGDAGHGDQPDRRLPRCLGCCRADRRQQPRSTGNRRPSPAIRELPRCAGGHGAASGRSGDQPPIDRRHHRCLRVGSHRQTGRLVTWR